MMPWIGRRRSRARTESDRGPRPAAIAHCVSGSCGHNGRMSSTPEPNADYSSGPLSPEERADIAAYDAALAEEGPNIPWEQIEAELDGS